MKRGMVRYVIVMSILAILIFFLFRNLSMLTGKSVFTPSYTINCSNDSIKVTWDSVFKTSSDGIRIITNNTVNQYMCSPFLAYKINGNEAYVAYSGVVGSNPGSILAFHGHFTPSAISAFESISSLSNLDYFIDSVEDNSTIRVSAINLSDANSTFQQIFEEPSAAWQSSEVEGEYYFTKTFGNATLDVSLTGSVDINYSFERLGTDEIRRSGDCAPNWTAYNTSCNTEERLLMWYVDNSDCRISDGRPDNRSVGCDYNHNGIIDEIDSYRSNFNVDLYIDSKPANKSEIFNTTRNVEFKEGNTTIVSFVYNFAYPLNMPQIEIKRQAATHFGNLIVNGLDVIKTVFIDKLNISNNVCIEDGRVNSISDVSPDCSGGEEYLVPCPGTNHNYSCNISGNRFMVSGLMHSAVREVPNSNFLNCTTNWSCGTFGICTNNQKTRTCIDTNNCGVLTGKPSETESCSSCVPNWACDSWVPSKCPENETQTRRCSDLNNCQQIRDESHKCSYNKFLLPLWLIIILAVILILIIITVILIIILRKNKGGNTDFSDVVGTYNQPPTSPPEFPSVAPKAIVPTMNPPITPTIPQKPLPAISYLNAI